MDGEDRHAWENPGAFEVLPGVHRIPLPLPGDGLHAVNVYAIEDGDGLVLIDGGWALGDSERVLERALRSIGRELPEIREFLVTHAHRDHYTQAVALRRRFGSQVRLGEGERACLAAMRDLDRSFDYRALLAAGADELVRQLDAALEERDAMDWEDPDRWLDDGVQLPLQSRTLRVIATPGHTAGHVVFHDVDHDALFAGDHVLPHITPSIGLEFIRPPAPLRDYLTSLQLTRALPDALLLPAHGPVADSVHKRVDELLAHHEDRLQETATVVDAGAHTGLAIAGALPWTRRGLRLTDLDTVNQMMAVQETMAHLTVLVERGWLTGADLDGITHFVRR